MSDELDSRAVLRAVSRRRRVMIALGLIGLCGGIAYGASTPVLPQADAELLLPSTATSSGGSAVPSPATDTATQIAIATSDPVLAEAARAVSPSPSLAQMRQRVTVQAVGSAILAVRARAPRPADAVRLADAVADDYIAYVTSTASGNGGALLDALNAQAGALTEQLSGLKAQVGSVTSDLRRAPSATSRHTDAVRLGALQNQVQQVGLELDTIESQLLEERLSTQATDGVIRVLQSAGPTTGASRLRYPMLAGVGLALGLFVGFITVLALGTRDRRLFRRAELATTLGLPVVASVRAARRRRVEHWSRLLEEYRPSTSDQWNLHRLLRYLEVDDAPTPLQVKLLAFSDDRAAQAVGPQLAVFSATSGIGTALAAPASETLESLRAACAARPALGGPGRLRILDVGDGPPRVGAAPDAAGSPAVLTVTVAVAERDRPEVGGPASSVTLLAVSAGFATADEIARLALACSDAGQRISGFVLVNPEAADRTSGELPAPLLGWRPRAQAAVRGQPGPRPPATRRSSSGGRKR